MNDEMKNKIITIGFICILLIVFFINCILKDSEISITERRKLAEFPQFSIESVLNKKFMTEFDKYAMDQFIERENFRKIKNLIELKVFKKRDLNNLYISENSIIKQDTKLNEKSILNFTNKINIIKNEYLDETNNVFYSIIPDKNYFADDKHLKYDYLELEKLVCNNIKNMEYINIFENLSLQDYYKTDSHWKQENLKVVVTKISKQMGFFDKLSFKYEEKEITNFSGVYFSQFQIGNMEDTLNVLTNENIENCVVYNFETNKTSAIYDMDKLNSYDKYNVFLSGPVTILEIKNENANTEKELIVFRDSFGSSLVPLFAEAYKKIVLIDTRYVATKYLGEFVDFSNKDILFIYSTTLINNSFLLK